MKCEKCGADRLLAPLAGHFVRLGDGGLRKALVCKSCRTAIASKTTKKPRPVCSRDSHKGAYRLRR